MNVLIESPDSGFNRPSTVKTSQILTISKERLENESLISAIQIWKILIRPLNYRLSLVVENRSLGQNKEDLDIGVHFVHSSFIPFKLEISKDLITSHAGLGLLGEFAGGLGLNKALDEYLPGPGGGTWYLPSEHVFLLILMLNGEEGKGKGLSLDIDATGIESEKESAKMT